MSKSIIGILAGMGPRSTAPFLEKVLDQCHVQYDAANDIDFPPIMIYSLPTPFHINKPIDHDTMESTIINGLRKLEQSGISFIAMPCNSAHKYFDRLRSSISVPLLNMIDITLQKIPSGKKKIAILGTESTINMELYQQKIKDKEAIPFHNSKIQNLINEILSLIKFDYNVNSAKHFWNVLLEHLKKNNVDIILSACTDLQPIINNGSLELPIWDTAECLAEQTVIKWLKSC